MTSPDSLEQLVQNARHLLANAVTFTDPNFRQLRDHWMSCYKTHFPAHNVHESKQPITANAEKHKTKKYE